MDIRRRMFHKKMRRLARPFPACTFEARIAELKGEIDSYLGGSAAEVKARKARPAPNRMEAGGENRSEG